MDPFFGAKIVRDLSEMRADQRKRYDEPILSREFQAHLEVVFEKSGVEAKDGEVGGLDEDGLQLIHHPGVEDDRVEDAGPSGGLELVQLGLAPAEREVGLESGPVQSQPTEVKGVLRVLHLLHRQVGDRLADGRQQDGIVTAVCN